MSTATLAAPSGLPAPDYVGLRPPRIPTDLSAPVAVWNPRDLTATVRDGAAVSVWSGLVSWIDERPGGFIGWGLYDVQLESITPEGEPSEAARECARAELDDRADEIGEAQCD